MKRVAVALENTGTRWLGGLNYYSNLFSAVDSWPDSEIEMIVVTGLHTDVSHFDGYVQVIRTSLLDKKSFPRFFRKLVQKIFKRDVLLYLFLRRHNIELLSHSGYLWSDCSIPTMPWIPDFQEFHLPGMFDSQRLAKRRKNYGSYVRYGNCVLLSSYSAKKDLNAYVSGGEVDSKVLQFASTLMRDIEWKDREDISQHYKLDRPWFHLPNQFWQHKNHVVVLEALKLAKDEGQHPLIVATGNTKDLRNPDFIISLRDKIKTYGLESCFLMPGIIPYEDMFSIMRHAIAVINPSKFEGWSTTVEEARSLGKQVILSNIDVHKEQQPPRSYFFDSDDAMKLSKLLIQLDTEFDFKKEDEMFMNAMEILTERQNLFASQYQKIVLDVIAESSKKKDHCKQ